MAWIGWDGFVWMRLILSWKSRARVANWWQEFALYVLMQQKIVCFLKIRAKNEVDTVKFGTYLALWYPEIFKFFIVEQTLFNLTSIY